MYLEGKTVVFVSYEDAVWGEQYAGKEGKVIEHYPEYNEVKVQFEDGQKISMSEDEIEVLD